MLNQTTDKRAVFDFEIDFLNGGGIQGQGFRLDIEGDEIAESGWKPDVGGKLSMASRMAIGEREPDLDWSGNRRTVARLARDQGVSGCKESRPALTGM
jgi:hypothetical protein